LSADEKALVDLLNKTRVKEKLGTLTVNPVLCRVARLHSENMARQEKMDHVLDGKARAAARDGGGYDYRVVGRDLAKAEGDAEVPAPPAGRRPQELDGVQGPPHNIPTPIHRGRHQQ